jgi:hypothetical protein
MRKHAAAAALVMTLVHADGVGARGLPCGVDVDAVRAYLRTGQGSGIEVGIPTPGQQLYAHLNYRVMGVNAPPVAQLVALIDGVPLCGPDAHEFSLGLEFTATCDKPWRATEGVHTLRWEIDPDNALAETDETNNVAETTFSVSRGTHIDLDAQRVYLRTALSPGPAVGHPGVGQSVYLFFDYQLIGSGSAVIAKLTALVDGQPYCDGPFTFNPGGVRTAVCNKPWVPVAGVHVLAWEIDSDRAVAESNELNNVAMLTSTIPVPAGIDLQALQASLRTASQGAGDEVTAPACGESLYFRLDYSASGGPVSAHLRALIDGRPQCLGWFTFQPAPDESVGCLSPWVAAPGQHTLRWEIDDMNDVAETDESNNAVEFTFDVGAGTACAGDCNADGAVSIDELVLAIDIALGAQPVSDCESIDADHDGRISVNELVAAVTNASNGCQP